MDRPENISAWSIEESIKPGMKICEVGVRSGQSSEMFLEKGAFVYMIDPWEHYAEYPEWNYNFNQDYEAVLNIAKNYEGKCQIIRKKSDDALNDIPSDLDLVYIDGNHETAYVADDVFNYWHKLKHGGYLAGDDWAMPTVMSGILQGFSRIVAKNNINQFNLIYKGRNWIVQKP